MAQPFCNRQAFSIFVRYTFRRCAPRASLSTTTNRNALLSFNKTLSRRMHTSPSRAEQNPRASKPESSDDAYIPFGDTSSPLPSNVGTNTTGNFPARSQAPSSDGKPFFPEIQLDLQYQIPKRESKAPYTPNRSTSPPPLSPFTLSESQEQTLHPQQPSTPSSKTMSPPPAQGPFTRLSRPSNPPKIRIRTENREEWQIQKDALNLKFGVEPWAPPKKLSPDAVDGIRALHAQYPDRFTTPVLAAHFEVSPENIRRILRSKWRPSPEEDEERRARWERRGAIVWQELASRRGFRPPKKWRQQGIGTDIPKHKKPEQLQLFAQRRREERMREQFAALEAEREAYSAALNGTTTETDGARGGSAVSPLGTVRLRKSGNVKAASSTSLSRAPRLSASRTRTQFQRRDKTSVA